ncbi:MAG: hypothetical protein VX473_03560 [Candidatus Thermoplasmatota archaeon]|nr:hypothetical protein [Candidatus Thermoplasmatota archaeon]
MRTGRTLAMLLAFSMLICMIPVSNAGSAPTNGGIYNVSTDETWNIGSEIDATVTVEAGATLTIATDYTLPAGASITVEEGGSLRVEDGSLTGGAFSQAVRMSPNVPTSLLIDSNVASGGFDLKIVATSGTNMSGWSVAGENRPAEDMTGSEHLLNFPGGIIEDYRLNFSLNLGSFADLVIDHLEIDEGGTITTIPAYLAEPINGRMASELGTLFPLNIEGTAHFEDSSVVGSDVLITGAVTSVDSHFTASGPLNVEGNSGSLSVQGGSITMSSTDHDVNLDGVASLTWTDTVGTGHLIDRWERNIGEQEIHIPIGSTCSGNYSCVHYEISGIGPNQMTMQRSNVEGVATVPARTVEIGYADGSIWTEDASIEIINFRTAWNPDRDGIESWSDGVNIPLPTNVATFDILPFLSYPVISVDSVHIPGETGVVGRSIPAEITVTNSGTEAAAIFIRCNEAGTETYADILPTYSSMMLDAGETETLKVNWTYKSAGDAGLDCYVEEPLQFMNSSWFVSQGSASSNETGGIVSWGVSNQDDAGLPITVMLAALAISIIVGLVVAIRFAAADAAFDPREVDHESEDLGRVDRFAKMMDEEE